MISRAQLQQISKKKGFELHVIEKDYALTWALKAIYSNSILQNYLIFKGGTCLSKAYAGQYRLSEDLDFTASKNIKLATPELEKQLSDAFLQANQLGAPSLRLLKEKTHENPGLTILQAGFTGPLEHANHLKIEVSTAETVVYAPERRPLKEKDYPDVPAFELNCYALTEILGEKLRATMQRGKTRDYYDVWQIMTRKELRKQAPQDLPAIREFVKEKCDLNQIPYEPELAFDPLRLAEAKKYWQDGLGRLVKPLPLFEDVISDLKKEFREEAELSEFNEDLDAEHVRNLFRSKGAELLANRCIGILSERLIQFKAKDVERTLDVLDELLKKHPPLAAIACHEARPALETLSGDQDKAIRQKAEALLKYVDNHR